jgi:hypothetical protein
LSRLVLHFIAHGTGRRRQNYAERDIAAINREVFDKTERDDVLVEIGISYLSQRIKHYAFVNLRHVQIMPKPGELCRTGWRPRGHRLCQNRER